jgi:hypothetical protein
VTAGKYRRWFHLWAVKRLEPFLIVEEVFLTQRHLNPREDRDPRSAVIAFFGPIGIVLCFAREKTVES